jgi:hypothetical protein
MTRMGPNDASGVVWANIMYLIFFRVLLNLTIVFSFI